MKKFLLGLIALAALASATPAQPDAAMRQKVFEKVWKTVNETFYDPNFNGVDWKAAHDKYLPLARNAGNETELYKTITEMLSLLKVSHLEAGPASALDKYQKSLASTGIGLRTVEGRIVVTRIMNGFPASAASIKPGYIITAVDGVAPTDTIDTLTRLSGAPQTSVLVRYLDEKDIEHETRLTRQQLSDSDRGDLAGLKVYSLFEQKRLENNVGYIYFSAFVPFIDDKIAAAFDSFKDATAIILDLRGNPGGDDSVAIKIDDRLFEKETQLMLIKTRRGVLRDMRAHGNKNAYKGKVVILVDEYSGSASEDITAGLQESGRAYVIGKTTMGSDLDADVARLPDGGLLIYPFGFMTTPKGLPVEGRGVIPNKAVELRRSDLLAGRDTQIEAALQYLKEN